MWYALCVKTGEEETVMNLLHKYLSANLLKCIVPKKMIPERKQGIFRDTMKLLFPGYIFVNTHITPEIYYTLRAVPNIHYMVCSGDHKKDQSFDCFSSIANEEMEWMLNLLNDQECITYSDIMKVNAKVRVISGPLKGQEAMIRRVDLRKRRVKLEIDFMGEPRCIDLGVNILAVIN
ncbi:antiterminator LoaP [Paenibacillus massiliensis]|uniref:antiterminator LoaP n=1 Tax=Paenibacillus massiliensis TaxID=225917 RepID=UPI00035E26A2|nr:antiterminator LoaP [Paenibacillus massiliensis]